MYRLALVLLLTLPACVASAPSTSGEAEADSGTGSTDAGALDGGGATDDAGRTDASASDAAGSGDAQTDATSDATSDADHDVDPGDENAELLAGINARLDRISALQYDRAQLGCDCLGDDVGNCMDNFASYFDEGIACTRSSLPALDRATLEAFDAGLPCEETALTSSLACEDDAACDADAVAACETPDACPAMPTTLAELVRACVDAN